MFGLQVGSDIFSQNQAGPLTLGASFSSPNAGGGLAMGINNFRFSEVAGVSTSVVEVNLMTYLLMAIVIAGLLFYYYFLITKNYTAHEESTNQ